MINATVEKRQFPRVNAKLPLRIADGLLGETLDLSESGIRFVIDRPLLPTETRARIEVSPEDSIDTEFKVAWDRPLAEEDKFSYGVSFTRLEEKDLEFLRKVLTRSQNIDERFVNITYQFRDYLVTIKNQFDEFDKNEISRNNRIIFLENQKTEIFEKITCFLRELWLTMEKLDKNNWKVYTHFLRGIVSYILVDYSEINSHIFRKPLGYSGDFMVMNYIYDYNKGAYLGESSFKMLLNNFACNVPISTSNIKRKDFFKIKILNLVNNKEKASILNVGSGSARELVELLDEGKLKKKFAFHCLDFEEKALDYIREKIGGISDKKGLSCDIKYLIRNYIDLAKNKNFDGLLKNYDFIYCSGVFDYLKDRIAARLIGALFSLLNKNGTLILCNANNKDSFYRVTYEIIGDWVFHHREKEQLIGWLKNILRAERASLLLLDF